MAGSSGPSSNDYSAGTSNLMSRKGNVLSLVYDKLGVGCVVIAETKYGQNLFHCWTLFGCIWTYNCLTRHLNFSPPCVPHTPRSISLRPSPTSPRSLMSSISILARGGGPLF